MSEEINELKKQIKKLTERIESVKEDVDKLVKIEKEDREDLIEQAKKYTKNIPEKVIDNMSRSDLRQTIAQNKPAAEIPTPPGEREDAIKPGETFDAFKKPEDWM